MSFCIPFPAGRSKHDLDQAIERNVAWINHYGLLPSQRAVEKFLTMNVAELGTMLYPSATKDGLDIAVDVLAFTAFYDDMHDGKLGRNRKAAAAFAKEFVALTLKPVDAPPASASPLARAWADLWARETAGRSAQWQKRAAASWRSWFLCFIAEAAAREAGSWPHSETYLRIRRQSMARGVFSDLIEVALGFELPDGIHESVHLSGILDVYADSVGLVNDVYSIAVDEASGEIHNLVLILEHERGYSRSEAIAEAIRIDRAGMDRWLNLHGQLHAVYEALSLTDEECLQVERYITELGSVVRANLDWHQFSGRYAPSVRQEYETEWNGGKR